MWKEKYGFAAVPPGDERQKEEHRLFIEAYDKYHSSIDRIERFVPDETLLYSTLNEVKKLLGYEER